MITNLNFHVYLPFLPSPSLVHAMKCICICDYKWMTTLWRDKVHTINICLKTYNFVGGQIQSNVRRNQKFHVLFVRFLTLIKTVHITN